MKFEHFEGVSADDQFDRLGKKEDLNFLSEEKLTEATISEDDEIKRAKQKINQITSEIDSYEDGPVIPGVFQNKEAELVEAKSELEIILKKQKLIKETAESVFDKNLDVKIKQQSSQN